MTDKARELLERVIAETDSSHFYSSEIDKEIRAYLAQPEVKREEEPVAWLSPTSRTFSTVETSHHTAPLFLHPAPQRSFVRLSEEEVSEILCSAQFNYEFARAIENALEEKNK